MAKAKRESIKEFWSRVDQEGRRAPAEDEKAKLLGYGLSKRQVHCALVCRFQPKDGSRTRPYVTPDSWACGRRDAKKPPPDCQEQLELDVLWVHSNHDKPLEEAPTLDARCLLEMAQKRPDEFFKIYQKCLPGIVRLQRERVEAGRRGVVERREKKIRRAKSLKRAAYREAARQREVLRQIQQREEANRRAEAQKRAQEQEEVRQREEAERRAAAYGEAERVAAAKAQAEEEEKKKQEALRQEEAKKRAEEEEKAHRREQRRPSRQQKNAAKANLSENGQQQELAVSAKSADDWVEI